MATARRNGNGGQGRKASPWGRGIAALVCGALVGAPLPALSQVSGLDDIAYQDSDYASRAMSQRGYALTGSTSAKGNSFWQYWWSDARGQCVRLAVNDYRVTQLIGTGAGDCNRGANLPVAPQARSDNSDLVNQSEDYVARQLPVRGYVLSHSASAKGGSYWQYWWSAQRDQCVRVAVNDGRASQLITTDEHDCNQTASGSSGPSKGAQVAIAAAALAGVAVLAHKSHENQKDRATQSPQDVAEFERGYRDGLYHQGYHNYNNRPDYSDGYHQGQRKARGRDRLPLEPGPSQRLRRLCQRQRPGRRTRRWRGERPAGSGLPQHQRLQGQRPRLHLLVERQHTPVHERRGPRRPPGSRSNRPAKATARDSRSRPPFWRAARWPQVLLHSGLRSQGPVAHLDLFIPEVAHVQVPNRSRRTAASRPAARPCRVGPAGGRARPPCGGGGPALGYSPANMDKRVSPRQDFYRYAAGHWLERRRSRPANRKSAASPSCRSISTSSCSS